MFLQQIQAEVQGTILPQSYDTGTCVVLEMLLVKKIFSADSVTSFLGKHTIGRPPGEMSKALTF